MSKKSKSRHRKVGLPPGALIYTGEKSTEKVNISVIDYTEETLTVHNAVAIKDEFNYKTTNTTTWINVDGIHQPETIAQIGNHFDIHPLIIEDILNTNHRPKAEIFPNYIFLTLKMISIDDANENTTMKQVSFILGNSWVISFQEAPGDMFGDIRNRLKENIGQFRLYKADYLLYRLTDTVVDNYFLITDFFSDKIELLEDRVIKPQNEDFLKEVQHTKKQILVFRNATAPLREAISVLEKDTLNIVSKRTQQYLKDIYEHLIYINDAIDTQRDILSGVMDLYFSGISNKMNEVMKVLTIIATIFIPLTFIAGVYGMNFKYMPELEMEYGYYSIWAVMLLIMIGMIIYFKRKDWL